MVNPNPHIWNLITAKLCGQLRPHQELELQAWLDKREENSQFYAEIALLWQQLPAPQIDDSPTDAVWDRLNHNLDVRDDAAVMPAVQVLGGRGNNKWLAVAGVLALTLLVGGYLFSNLSPSHALSSVNERAIQGSPESVQPAVLNHLIREDSLDQLRLPDGTRVWLNKQTELAYAKSFNSEIREVYLKGEAFFEVRRDSLRPFVIKTETSRTRVLGTAFNLKAYADQPSQLTVVSGKVTFSDTENDHSVVLSAGEQAVLNRKLGVLQKNRNQDPHFLDWKHALVYREEISHPADYLSEKFHKRKSAINQTEIEGIIYNHATLATYKNIKLKVQYYQKKKEKIKSHVFTVYQSVGPGETIDYRYRLADWFSPTDQLQIRVVDATVTKN